MRWCFFSPGHRSIQVLNGDSRTSGGAEAQIAHLAAALARMGNEVSLIYGDGKASGQRQVVSGVTCVDAAPSWRKPGSLLRFWKSLEHLDPDQIYARLPSDFLWMMGMFARRRQGSRFLYAIANDLHCSPWTSYDYNRWFHCPLYALGLWSAHAIATQHDRQRELLGMPLGQRAVPVPNLVRSIRENQRDYDATVYDAVWVAQIRPKKQLGLFLDAAESLPELRFAVAGGFDVTLSDDERALLQKRISGLANVSYLGPIRSEDVISLLAQSRVLVNTSSSEGFPNTMLEAWSMGVPVVSLCVDPGGVIGREGLGFVSGSLDNLQENLAALAGSKALNQEMGERGLAYVRRRHSLAALCEALSSAAPGAQLQPLTA